MIKALVHHGRRHTIAYLALICSLLALGGATAAALQIPFGSVGERQLRNDAIDPVKWDPNYVTGFVRRWATISPAGSIISTSPGGQSKSIGTGDVVVTWGDAFARWCAPVATVLGGSAVPPTTTTTTTATSTAPATTTVTSTARATTTSATTSTTTTSPQPTPSGGGYADASIVTRSGESTLVAVATYNSLGQPAAEPVSVAVLCGPGAGSGQSFPTNLP